MTRRDMTCCARTRALSACAVLHGASADSVHRLCLTMMEGSPDQGTGKALDSGTCIAYCFLSALFMRVGK